MNSKKELMEKAKFLEPCIRLGKNGLTSEVIEEIKKQIKKKRLIKVKFLKSALGEGKRKDFAKEIASKSDAELIHQVGFVVVLWKCIVS